MSPIWGITRHDEFCRVYSCHGYGGQIEMDNGLIFYFAQKDFGWICAIPYCRKVNEAGGAGGGVRKCVFVSICPVDRDVLRVGIYLAAFSLRR